MNHQRNRGRWRGALWFPCACLIARWVSSPGGVTILATELPNTPATISVAPASIEVGLHPRSSTVTWDTGNNLVGEVQVSRNGSPEVLVARGPRGSIEWRSRNGTSVFTLYRGTDRTHPLAQATARSVVVPVRKAWREKTRDPEAKELVRMVRTWPAAVRWSFVVALFLILYFAIAFGASKTTAAPPPPEENFSKIQSNVGRPLLLGLGACLALDAAIFHSPIYPSLLLPESSARYSAVVGTREKQRPPSGFDEILLVGDSRIARGFSSELANEIAQNAGYKFVNVAIGGSTPRLWYYLLREIDPNAERYRGIAFPVAYTDSERWAALGSDYLERERDITIAAPLLRYSDAFTFASSFRGWGNQCEAFACCILRGIAYRADFFDLLQNPARRFRELKRERAEEKMNPMRRYLALDSNVVGVAYDKLTGNLDLPKDLTPQQKTTIRKVIAPPPVKETGRWMSYRRRWIGGIEERYANSQTRIILLQTPRGPIVPLPRPPEAEVSSIGQLVKSDRTILLAENSFEFLEAPEYFADGYHLSSLGRQEFTERLVELVLPLLRRAGG